MDLIDIHRIFHLKAAAYSFFSSAHRTFSRIQHILAHKSSLGKFKKTEIISNIFSNLIVFGQKSIRGKRTGKNINI